MSALNSAFVHMSDTGVADATPDGIHGGDNMQCMLAYAQTIRSGRHSALAACRLVEAGAGEVGEGGGRNAACEAIRQLLVLSIDLIKIPS